MVIDAMNRAQAIQRIILGVLYMKKEKKKNYIEVEKELLNM